MLRELFHLMRHAPATLALQRRVDHVELYDTLMQRADNAGFAARRDELTAGLDGDVLEIGCGSGLMFAHYARGARVRAIEIDDDMIARARTRATPNVEILQADAEALPFPDASFDAAVSCLVFCSIPHAERALAEVHRVLRTGGELRMMEHVVSPSPVARTLMRAFDPVWLHLNRQGCHMSRDTVGAVREVFGDVTAEPFQIFSAGMPAFPMRSIRARRR